MKKNVSDAEMKEGMNRVVFQEVSADRQRNMEEVDSVINYTEFLGVMLKKKQDFQEDTCWAAFRVFVIIEEVDTNGNGEFVFDELMTMEAVWRPWRTGSSM